MINEEIAIPLPSLVHRIGGEKVKHAKSIAEQCHCKLKRVRRSRNWNLSGVAINIQLFVEQLKEIDSDGFGYLIRKIATALLDHADKLEPLEAKLIHLLSDNPNMTLSELMARTQCTLAEARLARFQSDSL